MNNTIKSLQILILLVLVTWSGSAQIEFSGEANLQGMLSSKEDLPFWFYSNQRGRVSSETSIAGWINGKMKYDISNDASLEIGAGVLYQDAFKDEVFIDELYADFKYKWLQVIAGRKQKEELYNGLSATNENILWSLNARPLTGIQISSETIYFNSSEKLGFDFAWEDYYQSDHTDDFAFLHHKNFHLIYNFNQKYSIRAGLQHFAQWGGNSPRFGNQPDGFEDYLRVVAGYQGGEDAGAGDQENVLGNHLGSWELFVIRKFKQSSVQLIYNSIFEDGSGSRLANAPDGRYGIFWEHNNEDKLINSIIYEFYYTRHQSHNVNRWGADNYFNNGTYSKGWAFKNKVIGLPLFTYDKETQLVINNKFIAHHIGIGGQFSSYFQSFPYRILLSYAHNEGTYRSTLNTEDLNEDVLNFYSKWRLLNLPIKVDAVLGLEFNSYKEPIYAGGISISKRF
ncbi:capsule assembly Wzi family protein [Gillisia sp. JM1]|uniref:capsule assembly Wzi family protein n=1 Tax=Gillisia sp. JM1 TaxID=1283286 RepID=UPI000422EB85|nr:capsule assembly Wzi family protein [Gillisia sp. JM1]